MDDLLSKFLPSKPPSTSEETNTSSVNDPLLSKFLPQQVKPETINVSPVSEANRIIAPPISGYTSEQSNELNKRPSYQEPSLTSKAGTAALELPTEYTGNLVQKAKEGVELFKSGMGDIVENKPASGVGKIGLGGLSAAISPITGAVKTFIEEPAAKIGGHEFGEKAGLLATSGLPVAKASQMIVKSLPGNKALTAVVDTIGKDNIANVIQELKSNDRLSLMDVVPATKRFAQKLITTEGQHQNKFEKFVQDRIGSGKNATTDIYDATMGTPVNIVDKVNLLKQAAKDVGTKEIEPAIKGSEFVDVSNVINNIDTKLKPGVNSIITAGEPLALGDIEKPLAAVRKFIMDEKSVRTDPKSLHQFQSALRAKADDLMNSQVGAERQQGYALMNVRNDIVEAIDKASPRIKLADGTEVGSYKQALSNFRDEKQVENAFQMGQLVTRNKLGRLEDSPEFWNNWVKSASPQELEAAREGARLAIQHQIASFKAGARKGQDIIESEHNLNKLSSLFGKDEINKMAKQLKDERNIAVTNQELIGNSQTAMRMKADSRVDLPVEKPVGISPIITAAADIGAAAIGGYPLATAGLTIAALGKKAKFKYADLPLAKAKNEHISNLLTATGPERDELIQILESQIPKPKLSMTSKARLALPFQNP